MEGAQSVIPLPAGGGGAASTPKPSPIGGGAATPAAGGPAAPVMPPDVFAPTNRPGEPITAGAPAGPGPNGNMLPPDHVQFLRAVAMEYPTPGIMRLLERAQQQGRR